MVRWRSRRALALFVVLAAACSTVGGRSASLKATKGSVTVLAVWSDTEQQRFTRVLAAFTRESGVTARYASSGDEDVARVLDRRVAAHDPPDVALLPQPALVARYARDGTIHEIDSFLGREVRERYGPVWQQLASVDGVLYGVWFKAAHKSLVWYDIGVFERLGLVAPDDLASFVRDTGVLRRAGISPFAVAASREDAWTLTDWFENLYARVAGVRRYDLLARHAIPWTDPSVVRTLRLYTELLAPANIAGGVPAALRMSFPQSVDAVFTSSPSGAATPASHAVGSGTLARLPRAAMVMEGDFVPGVAAHARPLGVAVDAFVFPGTTPESRVVIGGGDVAVLVRDTPAGRELMRYLATARAAAVWARAGGFISPNDDLDLTTYPDAVTRRTARSLLDAGDEFRFDLSDRQPVAFGGTAGTGMYAILRDLLADRNVGRAAQRLEAAATAAYGR